MARVIDITDKLNFEEKPKLLIKGCEITVNDDAPSMLKVMELMSVKPTAAEIVKMCNLLLDDENRAKLEEMHLSLKDYFTVIMQAVKIVSGDNDAGEEETPATT